MFHKIKTNKKLFLWIVSSFAVLFMALAAHAQIPPGDRAVEISKRARESVNRSGKQLVSSSKAFFQAFAANTSKLQEIIDTKKALKNSGMLDSNEAIEPNLNARFMVAVGELKEACDKHILELKRSLEIFEESIAKAIVNTQDVKSINSNYELALKEFKKHEQKKYDKAEKKAMGVLEACNQGDKHACNRYRSMKGKLMSISQQVRLYQTKVKIAQMNQRLGAAMRNKIKNDGPEIAYKMRNVLTHLYASFHKIADIMEVGGPDLKRAITHGIWGGLSTDELNENLDLAIESIEKLNSTIDTMVDSILADLDGVQSPTEGISSGLSGAQVNAEEELESLSRLRQSTFGG